MCCDDMRKAVSDSNVLPAMDGGAAIYGRPRFVHDGDHHWDDMTDTMRVMFCPFCGKGLPDGKETAWMEACDVP